MLFVRSSGMALKQRFFCPLPTSVANKTVSTQSCLTRPGPPAGRRDPTRPWYVRVLDSTNTNQTVRASGKTFKTVISIRWRAKGRAVFWPSRPNNKCLDLSSPKPGHTTGGSGRHGAGWTAGRVDAGQYKVPTFWWPWKPTAPLALQRNVNNCSERFFASANKGNPM